MTADRLTPQREAEIAARAEAATPGPWFLHDDWPGRVFSESQFNHHIARVTGSNPEANERFIALARTAVGELLAELAAVRAERDEARRELAKYVGKEPTVAEETEYLSSCLNAVHDVLNEADRTDRRTVAVAMLREAADGVRSENPADNRRRIYIDGKGNGWISVCADEGTEWVVPVQPEASVEQDVRDVADETGSLREIGRCW